MKNSFFTFCIIRIIAAFRCAGETGEQPGSQCSVDYRSLIGAKSGKPVKKMLKESPKKGDNLSGGIFEWVAHGSHVGNCGNEGDSCLRLFCGVSNKTCKKVYQRLFKDCVQI